MNKLIALLLLLMPLFSYAQDQSADSVWLFENYTKQEVYITMRDSVKLFTSIYLPKNTDSKHPILFMRTPYSVAPYGADTFRAFWKTYYMQYFKENYIMVLQDVRGRFMSEGEFVNVRPFKPNKKDKQTDEASDTYDAIDWLVKNLPNNNHNVGVYGISYPGYYATMAALSGSPYLKAVSPQAPVTDWFLGDDVHHNGAFFVMDNFSFCSGFDKIGKHPTKNWSKGFDYPVKDNYAFFLQNGTIQNLSALLADSVPYWKEMCDHPDYDDYWQQRNTRNYVQYIPDSIPTLIVGGLFDAEDCYGAFNLYKSIEQKTKNNNRLIIGPWAHGFWSKDSGAFLGNIRFGSNTSYIFRKTEDVFFRNNLEFRGKGMKAKKLPEATIFYSGANKWQVEEKWPPYSVNKKIYLQNSGNLSFESVTSTDSFDYYISDPAKPVPYTEDVHLHRTREYMTDDQRFASNRPDVLTYTTQILEKDLVVAGPVIADLFTSISTTDADFIVKIIDVFPDDFQYTDKDGKGNGKEYPMSGYQMLVRGEIMRGRYRNSFEHPEAFKPNEITEVKYALPDIAHVFKKGHRLMIQIQSSWFPLVDRNPQQFVNIYYAKPSDFIKSDIRIYHDKEHPSNIIIPVLNKDL